MGTVIYVRIYYNCYWVAWHVEFLTGIMDGNKIDKKTFGGTLSCRHKPIKPPHELQTAPQDEANVWENLNITVMLKLSHPHSQSEVSYYLYCFLSVCMHGQGRLCGKQTWRRVFLVVLLQ